MFKPFVQIIKHELHAMLRAKVEWMTPLVFYVLVVSLFPLTLGNDPEILASISPGIIWVATLLATTISMGYMFQKDAEHGFLDCLMLSTYPITLIALAKTLSHWLAYCLPLIIISPVLGFLLNLTNDEQYALIYTLLLGTPVLNFIGAIGASLTVGIRGHGFLLPILIMPFYVPILIFATGIMLTTRLHEPTLPYYAIMGALLLLSLAFGPLLTGQALKLGVNR